MTIDDLKDEITITEVLQNYGASFARGSFGSEWRPLNCPFCADKSGSGSINVGQGRYLCHQCGAPRDGKSGDIVDVVMFAEGLSSTKDAIAWIERHLL